MQAEYTFSGFEGELRDLNGPFGTSGRENHGKPVYKKLGSSSGHQVMMYFWDQRDGDQLHGWWLAPEVGGAHVWAMNPIGSATPPQAGWKVPWHGNVNPKVYCIPSGKRTSSESALGTAAKRALTTGSFGAEAGAGFGDRKNFWDNHNALGYAHTPWNQMMAAQKGTLPTSGNQPRSAMLDATQQVPSELRRAEVERRSEMEQQRGAEERLNTLVAQAKHLSEQAKKKLGEVKTNPTFKAMFEDVDKDKIIKSQDLKLQTDALDRVLTTIIRQIQTSKLATSNKILEGEEILKETKVPVSIWPEIRKKLINFVKECEQLLEEANNWKIKKEEKEAALWTRAADYLVEELDGVMTKAEQEVEKMKDAAALLSSDLSEHLSTDECLVASRATEEAIARATRAVQDAAAAITDKIPCFKNASSSALQKFRVLQGKIPAWNDEIHRLQKLAQDADKRGKAAQMVEERKAQAKIEAEHALKNESWNQAMIDDAWAEVYVVEDMLEQAEKETTKQSVKIAREAMASLEKTVVDFITKKEASNKAREILAKMGSKVGVLRRRALECQKKVSQLDFDELQDKIMAFGGRVMAYLEKKGISEDRLFESISKGADVVTAVQLRAWCEVVVGAKREEIAAALERADCPRPLTRQALNSEEFPALFHVFFEAHEDATLQANEDGTELMDVDRGTLVLLSGAPTGNLLPVRAAVGEGKGYLNTESPGWSRVPPYFECIMETVLTDGFEMKSFKVVRRLKIGEKVRIIEPPRMCETTGVTRMKAQALTDGKIGFCTVMKPGVQDYFKPDMALEDPVVLKDESKSPEGVRVVAGEPIEALRGGTWEYGTLIKGSTASSSAEVEWEKDESRQKVSKKDIRLRGSQHKVRFSQWSLDDFVQRIARKCNDELNNVKIPEFKVIADNGETLSSEKIRALGQELEAEALEQTKICEGVQKYCNDKAKDQALKDKLVESLENVYIRHNEFMSELNRFRKELKETVLSEVNKARSKEVEKNAEEKRAKEQEFEERKEKILQQGSDNIEILEGVCEDLPDEDAQLDQLQNHLALMEKAREETDKYFKLELEKAKKETISSGLMLDLITLQRKGRTNNTKVNNAFTKMKERVDDKISSKRDECFEDLRQTFRKRSICPGKIFDSITEKETVTHEEVMTEFKLTAGVGYHVSKGLPWPLSRSQFMLGFFNLVRFTGITDVEMIKDDNTTVSIKSDMLMEYIKEDGEYVRLRTLEGETIEGKVPSSKIRKLALKYDILKETVLTNKLELHQLKVLSRLKKGDKVLAIGLPVQSGSLLRMEAKVDGPTEDGEAGAIGWISMEGSGVNYLKPSVWTT